MSHDASQSDADLDWLAFTCHFCRAKLKIRSKYAHLRGRCPDCGIRIEPLQPVPYQSAASHTAEEPVGIAPINEEEWPEPALHDQPEPSYELVPTPLRWATEEKADRPGSADITAFEPPAAPEAAATTAARDSNPVEMTESQDWNPDPHTVPEKQEPGTLEDKTPYELTPGEPPPLPSPVPPVAEFAPYQLSDAEKKPIRAAPLPEKPLIQGVYDFPFRSYVLRVWIVQGLGFAVLTLIPAILHYVAEELGPAAFYMSAIFSGIGFLFALMVTGSFGSLWFLDVLEQTANGNEEIVWSDNSWKEGAVVFLRLGWALLMTVLLPTFLLSVVGLNTLVAFLLVAPVMTPVALLSVGSAPGWLAISFEVVARLIAKPRLFLALYLQTLPLWAVCATVCYAVVVWIPLSVAWLLTPVVGLILSAGMLIYARLLGRVGLLLTQGEPKAKKKRKRKKRPVAGSGADAVEQSEGERPEDQNRQPGA